MCTGVATGKPTVCTNVKFYRAVASCAGDQTCLGAIDWASQEMGCRECLCSGQFDTCMKPTIGQCGLNEIGPIMGIMTRTCRSDSTCMQNLYKDLTDGCFSCLMTGLSKGTMPSCLPTAGTQETCMLSEGPIMLSKITDNCKETGDGCRSTWSKYLPDDRAKKCYTCVLGVMGLPPSQQSERTERTLACYQAPPVRLPCTSVDISGFKKLSACTADADAKWDVCWDACADSTCRDGCEETMRREQRKCDEMYTAAQPSPTGSKVSDACFGCISLSTVAAEANSAKAREFDSEKCVPKVDCTAADEPVVKKGQACAKDGSGEKCRDSTAQELSNACYQCYLSQYTKIAQDTSCPKVTDQGGDKDPDPWCVAPKLCGMGSGPTPPGPPAPTPTPAPQGLCGGVNPVDPKPKCKDVGFYRAQLQCMGVQQCMDTTDWTPFQDCRKCYCSGGDDAACLDIPDNKCVLGDMSPLTTFVMSCGKLDKADPAAAKRCRTEAMGKLSDQCVGCLKNHVFSTSGSGISYCIPQVPTGSCDSEDSLGLWRAGICKGSQCQSDLDKILSTDTKRKCFACQLMQATKQQTGTDKEQDKKRLSGLVSCAKQVTTPQCSVADAGQFMKMNQCTKPAETKARQCQAACKGKADEDKCNQECDAVKESANRFCAMTNIDLDGNRQDRMSASCYGCIMTGYQAQVGNGDFDAVGKCMAKDQKCIAEDSPVVAAGANCSKDAAGEDCRDLASYDLSAGCVSCYFSNQGKLQQDPECMNKVTDNDGEKEADAFGCIKKVCAFDGQDVTKPPAPPMPNKRTGGLLKLVRTAKQTIKDYCANNACKALAEKIAKALYRELQKKLGSSNVDKVEVTHVCDIPTSQTTVTAADKLDENICHAAQAISGASASAGSRRGATLAACTSDAECQRVGAYVVDGKEDSDTMSAAVDNAVSSGDVGVSEVDSTVTGSTTSLGPETPAPSPDDGGDGSDAGLVLGVIFGILGALGIGVAAVFMLNRKNAAKLGHSPPYQSATKM
eukprot:TRINITY_DN57_c0_g2_i1.p1 TRINITY_DN57_c0_g2~~TRINITY_DN57_c0_g2_i1.p1  ORF type:complete len:1077 (+),score=331.29 TRINITY_DN57_c0_g2_i1:187-3231(+)